MLETVRVLFPDAAVRSGSPEPGAAYDFRFVPSSRRPNLVIPAGSPRAAARTVWRFSVAAGARDSATRLAAGVALRLGAARLAKESICVDRDADSIVRHLEAVLGEPIAVSIAIGSARANRKPVLELFDARGRSLAFAKVGVDADSRRDVEVEGANLDRLWGRVPDGMDIPQVIDQRDWRGHRVLVMTGLPTRWQHPRARGRVPGDLMEDFARFGGTKSVPLGSSPFWARHRARSMSLDTSAESSRLNRSMDRLERRWGGATVETGAWHGDWTPWNMAWRRGRLQLWDFERLDDAGLVGLDLVHYVVNETMQRSGVTQAELESALDRSQDLLQHRTEGAEVVVASYLAAIAVRYQAAVSGARGALIADRARFMIEALERKVDRA